MHIRLLQRLSKAFFSLIIVVLFLLEPMIDGGTLVYASNKTRTQNMLNGTAAYDLNHVIVLKKGAKKPILIALDSNSPKQVISISNKVSFQEKSAKKMLLQNKILNLLGDSTNLIVQPNYIYNVSAWTTDTTTTPYKAYPNDFEQNSGNPLTGKHWYYAKSRLPELWYLQGCQTADPKCGGSSSVTVAVLDTGLAYEDRNNTGATYSYSEKKWTYHKNSDMFSTQSINLYTNADEVPNNGIDDDSNGYIDDYNGFDATAYAICNDGLVGGVNCTAGNAGFAAEVGRPNDDYGHGTFVTSMITSLLDNYDVGDPGSVSPSSKIRIMPIKVNNYRTGLISSISVYEGLTYAINNNADVINMSFGTDTAFDSLTYGKIQAANTAGIVVVAASGNAATVTPTPPLYPANYPEVIAVGAVNNTDNRAFYSQYGPALDVMAYVGDATGSGYDVAWQKSITCISLGSCGTTTDFTLSVQMGIGTSYASPQVAGLAAILKSGKPTATNTDIRNAILNTATDIGTPGRDDETGYGIINFYLAYQTLVNNIAPTISVIKSSGYSDTIHKKFAVTWTAADPDNNADINFYYNTDNTSNIGTFISGCGTHKEDTNPTGECMFSALTIPNGKTSVFGCVDDGVNAKVCNHVPDITIDHNNIACGPLDSNTDNTVNINDFIDFAVSYRKTCTDDPTSYSTGCGAKDRNTDNTINITDLIYFAHKYNLSCI